MDTWRLGGDLWGYFDGHELTSMLYCGANLVPVNTTEAARAAFADRLRKTGRRCSSVVGPAAEVLDLWRLLEPAWGPCRELRGNQPLLAIDRPADVEPDPLVRYSTIDELEELLPACIAMFTEEVGVSPIAGGSAGAYRARIAELIRSGCSFVRMEGSRVVFKAEIGASSNQACQVQGVWVNPDLRGRGLSGPALAAIVRLARLHIAPVVSLYVNDYNTVARKAYQACGFAQVGVLATVLF